MRGALFLMVIGMTTLFFPSCKRAESQGPVPPTRSFPVRGFLRGIDFANRSVTVEHEDVPGYMPAMTMPFEVKEMAEVEPLKVGEALECKLVVTDRSSWIEDIKKIDPASIHLPAKSPVAPGSPSAKTARLRKGDSLPDFHLVDSKGRPLSRQTFIGRPLLLTFIFTRCPVPNFCPLMSNHFREIQRALVGDMGAAGQSQLLSISFDPDFDTPEILDRYAAAQTQDTDQWRFATGTPAEIKGLTQAFAVSVEAESGTINHGLATALVGPDGIIREIWRGNGWKPEEVLSALRAL